MFLNNWYSLLANKLCYGEIQPTVTNMNGVAAIIGTGSSVVHIELGSSSSYHPSINRVITTKMTTSSVGSGSSQQTAYCGVILGDGNVVPTLSDYKLSGNQITTVTYSHSIKKIVNENNECLLDCLYTLTNTGSETITISEIGLVSNSYLMVNSSKALYPILIERTVLDTPVVIEPSGVGQVRYTITFKLPTT